MLAASAEDESGRVEVRSAAGEDVEGLGGRRVYSGRLAGSVAAAAATSCCHSSCFVGVVMVLVGGGAGRAGDSSNSNTVGNNVLSSFYN